MRIDWHCVCGDAEASHSSSGLGEECYGHCQKTDHDCKGLGYRPIQHTVRTPAISRIFDEARRHFRPTHYTCDLSTDYQSLLEYDGRFIWILRDTGTELYRLDDQTPEALTRSLAAFRYWMGDGRGDREYFVYLWDGEFLVPIQTERAEFLMEDLRHSADALNY